MKTLTIRVSPAGGRMDRATHGHRIRYCVWCNLENSRHYFTSRRQAAAFAAETSRMITGAMVQCNATLADLYAQSREVWILSSPRTRSKFTMHECAQLREQIRELEMDLDTLARNAESVLPFARLVAWCQQAATISGHLQHLWQSKNDTLRAHACARMARAMKDLDHYLVSWATNPPGADRP